MESNQKAGGDGLAGTQKEAALRALVQQTGYQLRQVTTHPAGDQKKRTFFIQFLVDLTYFSSTWFRRTASGGMVARRPAGTARLLREAARSLWGNYPETCLKTSWCRCVRRWAFKGSHLRLQVDQVSSVASYTAYAQFLLFLTYLVHFIGMLFCRNKFPIYENHEEPKTLALLKS